MVVELFGYGYGKFEKAGDFSRVRQTRVKKFGIYPSSNMEFNRVAEPLLYVYIYMCLLMFKIDNI